VSYPSLEQYQEALQHPETALLDRELKGGHVSIGGLGLPIVMCGGFALTYTVNVPGKKYAVRCFHKQSPDLEKRYKAISAKLTEIRSSYFLPFEFQPQGVRIGGRTHPIVKMAWARGDTLGDFVAANFRNSAVVSSLRTSITQLAQALEQRSVAHGDIQPGNLMVADEGASVQLIDYDGMFVPEIGALGAAETGHRNFQHPKRNRQFDATLDRFSLTCIAVALRALEVEWKLWDETQSDSDSFLFRATDFSDPGSSTIFKRLMDNPAVASQAKALAAISLSEFNRTPTLADFLSGKGIPVTQIIVNTKPVAPPKYISQYAVLDVRDYAAFLHSVGSLVELVGQVTDVKRGYSSKAHRPYIFVNFGDWRGKIVKLTIWSAALPKLQHLVNSDLEGKWVSVVGLVEPPYVNRKYNYSHISIDINGTNQIRVIAQGEAAFRLGAKLGVANIRASEVNDVIAEKIREQTGSRTRKRPSAPTTSSAPPPRFPISSNAAILDQIRKAHGTGSWPSTPPIQPVATPPVSKPKKRPIKVPWWVWVAALLAVIFILKQ
jgi:hypothetical protein